MRRITTIFIFLTGGFSVNGQPLFKTIISPQPVVAGESFQVQYVLEDVNKTSFVKPPAFTGFRLITGPNVYTGTIPYLNGVKAVQNFVYTVEATRAGKFLIPGATTIVNGKFLKSNDVVIEVMPSGQMTGLSAKKTGDINSDYFLRPGEDPYAKIRRNLFLRVLVDKKNCFVGEPVVATYKLYSRLESKSDIVKNPGFYGFAVYDMINLADKEVVTENVNGKLFDVHTIRKVQLYPLQPGVFMIDAMEVKNRVEFSRTAVNKKTEQEIVEGVLGNNDEEHAEGNTETVETEMNTTPVAIHVKPVKEKNKPPAFNGAVGDFSISSGLHSSQLARNEEGVLEITIRGRGNFIQLSAPAVRWPAGIEGFEPVINDSLDRTKAPLTGSRTFRFAFVSATPGIYTLPPVILTFFDPDSGHYKTTTTPAQQLQINSKNKKTATLMIEPKKETGIHGRTLWVIAGTVLLVLAGAITWFFQKRRKGRLKPRKLESKQQRSVDEMFADASLLVHGEDKSFYSSLHGAIWEFFQQRLNISGSGMNKEELFMHMKKRGIDILTITAIRNILQQCEEGMFTTASLSVNKSRMLEQARELVKQVENLF